MAPCYLVNRVLWCLVISAGPSAAECAETLRLLRLAVQPLGRATQCRRHLIKSMLTPWVVHALSLCRHDPMAVVDALDFLVTILCPEHDSKELQDINEVLVWLVGAYGGRAGALASASAPAIIHSCLDLLAVVAVDQETLQALAPMLPDVLLSLDTAVHDQTQVAHCAAQAATFYTRHADTGDGRALLAPMVPMMVQVALRHSYHARLTSQCLQFAREVAGSRCQYINLEFVLPLVDVVLQQLGAEGSTGGSAATLAAVEVLGRLAAVVGVVVVGAGLCTRQALMERVPRIVGALETFRNHAPITISAVICFRRLAAARPPAGPSGLEEGTHAALWQALDAALVSWRLHRFKGPARLALDVAMVGFVSELTGPDSVSMTALADRHVSQDVLEAVTRCFTYKLAYGVQDTESIMGLGVTHLTACHRAQGCLALQCRSSRGVLLLADAVEACWRVSNPDVYWGVVPIAVLNEFVGVCGEALLALLPVIEEMDLVDRVLRVTGNVLRRTSRNLPWKLKWHLARSSAQVLEDHLTCIQVGKAAKPFRS